MCSVKHFQKSRTTVNKQKATLIPQFQFDAFMTLRLSHHHHHHHFESGKNSPYNERNRKRIMKHKTQTEKHKDKHE